MYEERTLAEPKYPKLKAFFTANNTSWIIFGLIILGGIITRLFLWDFTSSDMDVWKEAAQIFLSGDNPYKTTLDSFQVEGVKHFYAYFPLWMYICSLVLLIFPETWFFGVTKGLTLLFDLQVVVLLYFILQPKVKNVWRLRMPIAVWFITPIVLMTSSMHGKFDSLMFVFILLAMIMNQRDSFIPESIFLSLAIAVKPIMLILVPFFFRKEVKERNISRIFAKLGLLLAPILLLSIPFLSEPIVYLQGVLGVHVTRTHDMAPLFALLSLPFSSPNADKIIRIILTVVIILVWLLLIILYYLKDMDLYKASFFTFLAFNSLYWVFLVQYTMWIYTLYIPFTSKSKMKHWQLGTLTSFLIILSTTLLAVMGVFVKNGL